MLMFFRYFETSNKTLFILDPLNADRLPNEDDWMLHTPGGGLLEDHCPCLSPKLCPRVFGESPLDSQQFGHIPICRDLAKVRCCGVTVTNKTDDKNVSFVRSSDSADMQIKTESTLHFNKTVQNMKNSTYGFRSNTDIEKDYEDVSDQDTSKTFEEHENLTQSIVFIYPSTIPNKKFKPLNTTDVYIILPTNLNNSELNLMEHDNIHNKINMTHKMKANGSNTSTNIYKTFDNRIKNENIFLHNTTERTGYVNKMYTDLDNRNSKSNLITLNKLSEKTTLELSSSNKRRNLLFPRNNTLTFLNEFLKRRSHNYKNYYNSNNHKNNSVKSTSETPDHWNISDSLDKNNLFTHSSGVKTIQDESSKSPVTSTGTNKPTTKQLVGEPVLDYLKLQSTDQSKFKIPNRIIQFQLQRKKSSELLEKHPTSLVNKAPQSEVIYTGNADSKILKNEKFVNGMEIQNKIKNIEEMLIFKLLEDQENLQKKMIIKSQITKEIKNISDNPQNLNCNRKLICQWRKGCQMLKTCSLSNSNHINKCLEKYIEIESKFGNKTRECIIPHQEHTDLVLKDSVRTTDLEGSETAQQPLSSPIRSNFKPPSETEGGFIPIERPVLNIVGPIPKGFRDQRQQSENNFETTVDGILMSQLLLPYESLTNFRDNQG